MQRVTSISLRRIYLLAVTFSLLIITSPLVSYSKEVVTKVTYQKSVPITVLYPKGYDKTVSYPVILTLPPGQGNGQMVKVNLQSYWKNEATNKGYVVVCPEVLGTSLISEGKASISAVLNWIDKNIKTEKNKIILTGSSNGGIGAFFTATAFPDRFSMVIVMPGGYLSRTNNLEKLKGMPVWLLVGEKDAQWTMLSKRTEKLLNKVGAKPELEILEGQGHMLKIDSKKLIGWIESHLSPQDEKTEKEEPVKN